MTSKPSYAVPSMSEIKNITWNGRTVASTFSGAGGSCLGYRMAGYRVAWASEFVPAAQEVYKANHPNSILDIRNIRDVKPQEILEAIGIEKGELDILDGSPPCASFSTAGKRDKGWGKQSKYSDVTQRTDDLFFEYARILRGLQPKAFIAENVSGLVKGRAKGYFKEILAELKTCGYKVGAQVLDSQWLGVPQARQRLIFIGIREDLNMKPVFPTPLPYRYTIQDAIPWIVNNENTPTIEDDAWMHKHATGKAWDELKGIGQSKRYFQLVRPDPKKPSPTLTASGGNAGLASVTHPYEKRKFSIAEVKRLQAFPDDFTLLGNYARQYERLGRSVPPVMMMHIAKTMQKEILDKCAE